MQWSGDPTSFQLGPCHETTAPACLAPISTDLRLQHLQWLGSIRSGFKTALFLIHRLCTDQLAASTFLKTFNTVRLALELSLPLR
jgi:hypothetical protein